LDLVVEKVVRLQMYCVANLTSEDGDEDHHSERLWIWVMVLSVFWGG
jgi:hypothetical protein